MSVVITGGICTGKSSACAILKEFGYHIIDADKIAHRILDDNALNIAQMFGDEFVSNGQVDRKKLGLVIFSDKRKKRILEDFLHPLIRMRIAKQKDEAEKSGKKYILDIPLFFETNSYDADQVILVYAPKEIQLQRLIARDGLSKEEALLRIESQMDIEKKKELSDIVIDNTKDLKNLKRELADAGFKI